MDLRVQGLEWSLKMEKYHLYGCKGFGKRSYYIIVEVWFVPIWILDGQKSVHPMRIELMTSGLWDLRSTNWAKGAGRGRVNANNITRFILAWYSMHTSWFIVHQYIPMTCIYHHQWVTCSKIGIHDISCPSFCSVPHP